MSPLVTVALIVCSLVFSFTILSIVFRGQQEGARDKKNSILISIALLCLVTAITLIPYFIVMSLDAPTSYIRKKIAKSEAPECLQQHLDRMLDKRAVARFDVTMADKACATSTRQRQALQTPASLP